MPGNAKGTRSAGLIILHGAEFSLRREVARRLHQHGDFASGAFVEARLCAVPRSLHEKALFGSVEEELIPLFPLDSEMAPFPWIEAALGGTLFIDELDCLCPSMQKRLLLWQKKLNKPKQNVIIGSRYNLDLLKKSGGLIPEFAAWLGTLPPTCRLGPERLRAVQTLSEENNDYSVTSLRLPGLAAVLGPVLQTYVTLGLESGSKELHATILGEVERPLIALVLRHTCGNQLRAASLLGLNRNTLRKRMKELRITALKK